MDWLDLLAFQGTLKSQPSTKDKTKKRPRLKRSKTVFIPREPDHLCRTSAEIYQKAARINVNLLTALYKIHIKINYILADTDKRIPKKSLLTLAKDLGKETARRLSDNYTSYSSQKSKENISFFYHRVRHKFQLLPPSRNYPGVPRWNFKLVPVHRELRDQERGILLQLVGGRFNEKGNLPGLSLVVEKPNRSLHLLAWVLSFYGDLNEVKLYEQSKFQ